LINSILFKEKLHGIKNLFNNSDVSVLAIALSATIPTLSVSSIVHEELIGKDQGGETGGMTEGQTDPNGEGDVDLGTGWP